MVASIITFYRAIKPQVIIFQNSATLNVFDQLFENSNKLLKYFFFKIFDIYSFLKHFIQVNVLNHSAIKISQTARRPPKK